MRYLMIFIYKQALSCLFPVLIFITLAVTQYVRIPFLPRYDLILLMCLLYQVILYKTGLETLEELQVICFFHLIGLALELFKVHVGSWSYPEPAYTKLFGVPLYSGFMYASVASYMCQAWRRLDLRLENPPLPWLNAIVGIMIYLNFFTDHYFYDLRSVLTAILVVFCFRSKVRYTLGDKQFCMPLLLSYFLIGFFIWLAENIATFLGAWNYPEQLQHWQVVNVGKISSWFLLCIVSFIAVSWLKVRTQK